MPTYQYVCTECGGQLEAVQKFTDEALTVHEACGGRLRKVFSPVGIVFKGSGFYRTDSRSGSSGAVASAPASAPAASGAAAGSSATPATGGEKAAPASPAPASGSSGTPAGGSSGEKVA